MTRFKIQEVGRLVEIHHQSRSETELEKDVSIPGLKESILLKCPYHPK
jgi:hypothetical protein